MVNFLLTEYNADIYVTGSNPRMLSSEISAYLIGLTGRYISFRKLSPPASGWLPATCLLPHAEVNG